MKEFIANLLLIKNRTKVDDILSVSGAIISMISGRWKKEVQFIESIHGKVTPTNLRIYQASIKDFKPAVQKRKLSAVNQFLYYLYQERFISEYHRLVLPGIQLVSILPRPR